jgi:phosphohistidine phosphatase
MELYLLRHAVAVERGAPGFSDDRLRPLTSEGEAKMRSIASGMRALGLGFDLILSSPYVRAKATADIVARAFRLRRKLELCAALASGDQAALVQELRSRPTVSQRVLLVGHEPYLSELASVLLSGQNSTRLKLKKGGLCKLATEDLQLSRCAELEWLLTPKQLIPLANARK